MGGRLPFRTTAGNFLILERNLHCNVGPLGKSQKNPRIIFTHPSKSQPCCLAACPGACRATSSATRARGVGPVGRAPQARHFSGLHSGSSEMTDQWSDCRKVFHHVRKTAAEYCRRRRLSPRSVEAPVGLGVPGPWVSLRLLTCFTPGQLGHDRRCAGEIAHWRGAQDVVASASMRRKPRDGPSSERPYHTAKRRFVAITVQERSRPP